MRAAAGFFILISFLSPLFGVTQEWEYQLDAYYTAVDYTVHLTTAPIPYYDNTSEWEIYKRLFKSPMPRYLIVEGSVNPLPLAGVYVKRQARSLYDKADYGREQNLIQSVTAGFEEPAALSIFLGNVIEFKPTKRKSYAEGKGYIGYLFSAGNYHIKDNELIHDDWMEAEWKIKGDKKKSDIKLQWSFRAGAKLHSHAGIADVFYVGLRRSRVDYGNHQFSWLRNSGAMVKFDFDLHRYNPIQYEMIVDRKFPVKKSKVVPSLAIGFIYRTRDKYSRELQSDSEEFQLLLQPNLEF
jgi:hypothetical protein